MPLFLQIAVGLVLAYTTRALIIAVLTYYAQRKTRRDAKKFLDSFHEGSAAAAGGAVEVAMKSKIDAAFRRGDNDRTTTITDNDDDDGIGGHYL